MWLGWAVHRSGQPSISGNTNSQHTQYFHTFVPGMLSSSFTSSNRVASLIKANSTFPPVISAAGLFTSIEPSTRKGRSASVESGHKTSDSFLSPQNRIARHWNPYIQYFMWSIQSICSRLPRQVDSPYNQLGLAREPGQPWNMAGQRTSSDERALAKRHLCHPSPLTRKLT